MTVAYYREAVVERRQDTLRRSSFGRSAAEIARTLGVSQRTIQRYRQHERNARPAQTRPSHSAEGLGRRQEVARLIEAGMTYRAIAALLNVSDSTVWRDRRAMRS